MGISTCQPVNLSTRVEEVNKGVQGTMGISYTCRPVNLSSRVDRSVNILYQGIMSILYLFICWSVNPSGVQGIMGISYLFTCRPVLWHYGYFLLVHLSTCQPVNLSTRVDRSRGKYRMSGHYGYFVLVHLSTCQPVYQGWQVQRSSGRRYGVFICCCRCPKWLFTRISSWSLFMLVNVCLFRYVKIILGTIC